MEELGVQDDYKMKEAAEQQDDESSSSEKEVKVELRDDDSFEVISISCYDSSKYSPSGDSDEDEALVISICDSMNKSFPEVQLLSDLVESTPSSITLTPENALFHDKCVSPKVDLIEEVRHEIFPDNAVSSSFSQGDESSSIVVMREPPEVQEPVLNTEYTSFPPQSQSVQEDHLVSQLQLERSENVVNFHGKSSSSVSSPADVFEKPPISDSAVCSDVNMTKEYPNTNTTMELCEGSSVRGTPQKLHSVFAEEQFENCAQLSASSPENQAKGSDVATDNRKDSPVKTILNVNHLPKVQNSATGLWGWLCPKKFMHKIIDKAWASIDSVINTLDPQMKNAVKPDFEVLITTTCDSESWPLRKAFRKVFVEKAGIANLSVTLGCVPAQPVGFRSGLYCAERRIKFMREHKLVDESKVIVATSPVLVEVTPLRWHHTTCLMLDDPHLGLTLHTFTQTVPVPNVYVSQAQLRTASDYHLKHLGFSITVGRVISVMTGMPENDWQYAMTGTSFNKILESAAVVLAGMYKSYLDGVSY